MAKWTLVKKSSMHASASKMKAGDAAPMAFTIVDNGNQHFDVMGASAAGNPVDISGVATLAAVSSDPTLLSASVSGMGFDVAAIGPVGDCSVDLTATWNDGSLGPFTASIAESITVGPANQIVVTPGAVTSH